MRKKIKKVCPIINMYVQRDVEDILEGRQPQWKTTLNSKKSANLAV
jgi:hypothetical protein